jgi:hypothetical protein
LCAEIRGGIDQEALVAILDVNRRPQPLVARIVRAAHRAVAPDHRDSVTGAGAQECDAHPFIIGELRGVVKSIAQ